MATLAIAGLGALGTSAVGLGWQAGWLIGAAVGSVFLGPKGQDTEGPRLTDLAVTSSAYGAPIAIGYGTVRMGGNMIWSSGIREERQVRRAGKGGGPKHTTYSYVASFAIAFAEGPADAVIRIWADGKLIHDRTGGSADVSKPRLRFRFHPGSETQLPDPLIEAAEGHGQVPAHRGLCYIVFEDLPLEDFGNRVPNISAEIAFTGTPSQPSEAIAFIAHGDGGYFSGYQTDRLAIDWHRGKGYLVTASAEFAAGGIRRFDLATMTEDRQARLADIVASTDGLGNGFIGPLLCGSDGHLYCTTGSGNSRPILRIDPDALREVARFGVDGSGLSNTDEVFVGSGHLALLSAYGLGGRSDYLLCGSLQNHIGLLTASSLTYVWGAGETIDEARVRGMVAGAVYEGSGEGWILGSAASGTDHTSLGLYRITVGGGAPALEKMPAIAPTDLDPAATGFHGAASALVHDATDDGVMFLIRPSFGGTQGPMHALKWRDGDGVVWSTALPLATDDGTVSSHNASRLTGQRWGLRLDADERVVQLDTSTGEIVYDETWTGAIGSATSRAQAYDAATGSIVTSVASASGGWRRLFLDRAAGESETLGSILTDLCQRAGLGVADIDVTEATEDVQGYVVGRETTVRGGIEPLASAFFFDAVESDDALRFRRRGRAPAATLGRDDLVVLDEATGEVWRERRTQEVELPARVSVVYMNRLAGYEQGSQSARRAALPVPTMASRHQISSELPIALAPTEARRIADRALFSAWQERTTYEAQVPRDWLRLDPTDVVAVELPGASFQIRLTRVDVGADFSVALQGVSEEAATYVSAVEGDGGAGRPVQSVSGNPATRLFVPDLPLLRDVDDTGGSASRIYAMMGGYGSGAWPGAALYRSADGIDWTPVGRAPGEIAWGAAANALGEPASPWSTDEVNELRVFMTVGGDRIESVTQEAMLNGANAALLIKANGEPEVIQFRDATLEAAGCFSLRGLLRGRRGTEVFVAGHAAGEAFVLLEPSTVETLAIPLDDLGLVRRWRAVGLGQLFEDAETLSRTHRGRDLMPWAPVHVSAALSGMPADIVLSWERRTRLGGGLQDGTGTVPLGETLEAYEVDILDGPGGQVLRTLASASPSATYANADILADFGAVPTELSVAVHQLSAVAGRGFARRATLEIA